MKTSKNIFLLILIPVLISSCAQKGKQQESKKAGAVPISLATDKDPVCHMNIKGIHADTASYQSKVYGFCSATCKDSFKKDPDQFLSRK